MRSIPPVALSLVCAAWLAFGPYPLSPVYRYALFAFAGGVLLLLVFKATRKAISLLPVHMAFWVVWSVLYFVLGPQHAPIPASKESVAEAAASSAPEAVKDAPVSGASAKSEARKPSYTGPIQISGNNAPPMRTSVHDTNLSAPFLDLGATPAAPPTPKPSGFGSAF